MISLPIFLNAQQGQSEESAPGVGRVSYTHGDVSVMRGDSGEWVATTVNGPLVPGDKIATGQGSRAEVQLDYANVLRIDQSTEAKVADLTRNRIQIQLASGLADFAVLKGAQADVEIDTPNMAVHPRGEGTYRIQVNSPSDTQVTVRRGEAEISTGQGNTSVENGQVIYVKGTENPEYQIAHGAAYDDWDRWNQERDRSIEEAASYQHTNRYYTGANDLDHYGRWQEVPDYGWSWTPAVDAGWVPYSDGRWVWEPYWGWTWVSYEPWGWAPYHYGRWFWYGDSWSWWPGYVTPYYNPIWAPAYVSFLGFGFGGRHWGFGFGFGFSSIGWCPLGPWDGFNPWWGVGNSFTAVNITNVTNVTNINNFGSNRGHIIGSILQGALTNGNIRRGITTVSVEDFAKGNVERQLRPMDAATLRQASVVKGSLPVVPTRQSLQPVNRPVNRGALPTASANSQRFFSTRQAPAGPTPFAQRAAEIQGMVQTHRSLSTDAAAAGQASFNGTNRPGGGMASVMGTANAGRGIAARPSGAAQAMSSTSASAGWQRFSTGRAAPASDLRHFQGMQGWQGRAPAAANSPAYNRQTAPASGSSNQSGWKRFSTQPRPASAGPGPTAVVPRSETASPGWSRFTPRPANNSPQWSRGWSTPAPRGDYSRPAPQYGYSTSGRPPLQLRRPIVTERSYGSPPSYGGGGYRGGYAPSGGGRGWSTPSYGGSGYRGGSAPSGGYRGGSAPSGGGSHGGSAPSGGGSHSAPSSHGGGKH